MAASEQQAIHLIGNIAINAPQPFFHRLHGQTTDSNFRRTIMKPLLLSGPRKPLHEILIAVRAAMLWVAHG